MRKSINESGAVLAGSSGNRPQRHAVELASRRWRGGQTRRDNLIYALEATHARDQQRIDVIVIVVVVAGRELESAIEDPTVQRC